MENGKLTGAVAPFLISIVVGCHGAPRTIMVLSCAAVVATSFVDERESTAITRRCTPATSSYKSKRTNCLKLNYITKAPFIWKKVFPGKRVTLLPELPEKQKQETKTWLV